MSKVRKIVSFLFLITCFIAESIFHHRIGGRKKFRSLESRKKCASRIATYANRALRILGIRTYLLDAPPEVRSGLIVSNHLSYVDVLVLSRVAPFLFITSMEVKNSFGLGLITRLGGCLFVERRSRNHLKAESNSIQEVLSARIPVVLFPEGTSSQGSEVLPFRPALFQSAIDARVPVHLFQISYDDECVPYHGEHLFLPHLLQLCSRKRIRANLQYLGRISSESVDRKTLANLAESRIRSAHVSRISRSTSTQPVLANLGHRPESLESQVGLL
ncbi:MAG: 1-acyl-sn-glycerol-3-phosphate acyltransferase [Bdellovibrionales bacterium]|nr:1-acyl-sn-glycerol-3-phosphate acyltransferase [Bdellovibrionales bacterium]